MSVFKLIGQDPDMLFGIDCDQGIAGKSFDISGNGYDADLVGNPRQGRDRFGSYFRCDGSANYLENGTVGTIKTVLMWINPESTTEDFADLDGGTHTIEITAGTLTATGFASPTLYVDGVPGTTVVANKRQMIVATTDTGIITNAMESGLLDGKQYTLAGYSIAKSAAWIQQEFNRAKYYF